MVKIVYGMTINDKDDEYISNAEEALRVLGEAGTPGRFLVDIFPSMKWIPIWFPGAEWKRKAKYWASSNAKVLSHPFEWVKKQMVKRHSFTDTPIHVAERQLRMRAVPFLRSVLR
jgi:hypothetical protein